MGKFDFLRSLCNIALYVFAFLYTNGFQVLRKIVPDEVKSDQTHENYEVIFLYASIHVLKKKPQNQIVWQ